jgi:hypothetical protein
MHGLGRLTCNSGLIYVGHFDKNSFHGIGKLSLPNGSTFEGILTIILSWYVRYSYIIIMYRTQIDYYYYKLMI